VPAPVDLAAYRIVQEALTNVLRHADARTVRLALTHEPSRLLIRIRDDGPIAGHRTAAGPGGHGIAGMSERARALSGRLTAAPHPDGGFEVCAELPVPNPR
jgi:signal transduction histidine kinase